MKLDQQEREAVLRALSVLPHDHPARIAFDRGADPIALMHLLEGDEAVENLKEIWLAAYHRLLQREGRYLARATRDYPGVRAATNMNAAPRQVIPMRLMAALGPAWE